MKKIFLTYFFIIFSTNLYASNIKKVYFAGGCFWCMEESFDKVKGFIETISGYSGGHVKNPKYKDVLLDLYDFFEKNIQGRLKNNNLIIDPGIGFGKTLKHNLTLISKISLFHSLGLPIMIGTSRKRFINQIADTYDSKERLGGTMASVLYLLSQGVQIFRVHNVLEIKQGILVFNKILFEKCEINTLAQMELEEQLIKEILLVRNFSNLDWHLEHISRIKKKINKLQS